MSKGENIFKRKDGRWEARYIKGHELSGKIRYGFCYGRTYREAKEKVTKFKAALAAGAAFPATDSRRRAHRPPNRLPPPPRNQMIRTRNPNGNLDSDHFLFGAGNRTRTCTLLAVEPKSTESTNSTMPAFLALCRDGTTLF